MKRGQETDERTGETVLDHNFRPEYKAERGERPTKQSAQAWPPSEGRARA